MMLADIIENKYKLHKLNEDVSCLFRPGLSIVCSQTRGCSFVTGVKRGPHLLIDWQNSTYESGERLLFLDVISPEDEWDLTKQEMRFLADRNFAVTDEGGFPVATQFTWEFSPNQPYYKFINMEKQVFQYAEQSIIVPSLLDNQKNYYGFIFLC
jgi:hypothetical protein